MTSIPNQAGTYILDGKTPVLDLYTAPPKREPLTEEEIQSLADEFLDWNLAGIESFARAIERAHGIGGEE